MANQVTQTARFVSKHDDGTSPVDSGSGSAVIALAGSDVYSYRKTITQAAEVSLVLATIFPNLGANAHVQIKNLNGTNFVKFGWLTGVYNARISPKLSAMMQAEDGLGLFMIADTADCDVEITALNL